MRRYTISAPRQEEKAEEFRLIGTRKALSLATKLRTKMQADSEPAEIYVRDPRRGHGDMLKVIVMPGGITVHRF